MVSSVVLGIIAHKAGRNVDGITRHIKEIQVNGGSNMERIAMDVAEIKSATLENLSLQREVRRLYPPEDFERQVRATDFLLKRERSREREENTGD